MTCEVIFSFYILLEKTCSQLIGLLTEAHPSVSCLQSPTREPPADPWPGPLPLMRDILGREYVTGPTLPSQQEVFKAWQAWVTCQAVRLSEPTVERMPVSLEPYFIFLCEVYCYLPVPRVDLWCHSSWTPIIQSSVQEMRYNLK